MELVRRLRSVSSPLDLPAGTPLLFPGKKTPLLSAQHGQLFGYVGGIPYGLWGRLVPYEGGSDTLPAASWTMLFLPRLPSWSREIDPLSRLRSTRNPIGAARGDDPSDPGQTGSRPRRLGCLPNQRAETDPFRRPWISASGVLAPVVSPTLTLREIGGLCSRGIPPPRSNWKRAETRAVLHVS